MNGRKARQRKRKAEAEVYAKDARFWAKAPKSALSLDSYITPVNKQASRGMKPAKKR